MSKEAAMDGSEAGLIRRGEGGGEMVRMGRGSWASWSWGIPVPFAFVFFSIISAATTVGCLFVYRKANEEKAKDETIGQTSHLIGHGHVGEVLNGPFYTPPWLIFYVICRFFLCQT